MSDIFINNDIETSNVGILPLNSINKLESNNIEVRNVEMFTINACIKTSEINYIKIPQIGSIERVIESGYINYLCRFKSN